MEDESQPLSLAAINSSAAELLPVEVVVLDSPNGNVVGLGSYYGGPEYEFVIAADGQVYFQVVGDVQRVWAGPDAESFRRIATAWNRYKSEYRSDLSEAEKRELLDRMRTEFNALGALPKDLPPDPEPLWSLLLFEAESELG